jgi:hypothetical protein
VDTIPTPEQFNEAAVAIQQITPLRPKVAIVLGSGLSALADAVACLMVFVCACIPNKTLMGAQNLPSQKFYVAHWQR